MPDIDIVRSLAQAGHRALVLVALTTVTSPGGGATRIDQDRPRP